jgi:hypothetical protein
MGSTDRAQQPDTGADRGKQARRDDVALVTSYHEAQLQKLLEHLRDGFRRYQEGAVDAFELDAVVRQYTRAARELWKFCGDLSGAGAAFTARALSEMREEADEVDWWERGRPPAT